MPAMSKRQFRFMAMVAHNKDKMKNPPEGLSSAKAEEFVHATPSYKALPEKKTNKFHKLRKVLKN